MTSKKVVCNGCNQSFDGFCIECKNNVPLKSGEGVCTDKGHFCDIDCASKNYNYDWEYDCWYEEVEDD